MRLQLIACKVLQKEIYYCAARSKNVIDIVFLEQGLHEIPTNLNEQLKKTLEITHDQQGNKYDAILLGYGLCSNGIVGLNAKIPLVVPRAHDCITILLGSKEKYKEYFDSHRGIYWYSCGWIETNEMPCKEKYEKLLAEYIEKYGEDNAKYLLEVEQGWIGEYEWTTYIDWALGNAEKDIAFTKQSADFLKLNYDQIKGDPSLLQRLLDGDWADEDFLVLKPGQVIADDLTCAHIIKAKDQDI